MNSGGYFEYDKKSQRLLEVNAELESPKVWDDANRARELGKEKRLIDDVISRINTLTTESQGAAELLELAEMEGDEATLLSLNSDEKARYKGINKNNCQLNMLFALSNLYMVRAEVCP